MSVMCPSSRVKIKYLFTVLSTNGIGKRRRLYENFDKRKIRTEADAGSGYGGERKAVVSIKDIAGKTGYF